MVCVNEEKSLSRKFLHLLMQEQLQTLDLSFGVGEIHYGIMFLPRCKVSAFFYSASKFIMLIHTYKVAMNI